MNDLRLNCEPATVVTRENHLPCTYPALMPNVLLIYSVQVNHEGLHEQFLRLFAQEATKPHDGCMSTILILRRHAAAAIYK